MPEPGGALRYKGLPRPPGPESSAEARLLDTLADWNPIPLDPEELSAEQERAALEWRHRTQYEMLRTGTFPDPGETEEALRELERRTERELRVEKILREIIRLEALEVTPGELETAGRDLARRQGVPEQAAAELLGEGFPGLREDLLMGKAIRLVWDHTVPCR